ncbi:MAG: heme-binding protein [Salaquimonas sp.]
MPDLTLARANKMIKTAFMKAEELGLKPLGVCVYDAGGNLKAFQLQDGASIGRFAFASGKARGALATGTGSRWLNNQAADRPHFLAGVNSVIEGGVVPVPGGVLARNKKGEIVAAVGISGDLSDKDEACAVAGIEICGFSADIG